MLDLTLLLPEYKEHKDRVKRIHSATAAIRALLPLALYPAHKRELLGTCIWKISESNGKFNLRFWSEGVLSIKRSLWPSERVHEHVNERRELISRLLAGEDMDKVVRDVIACLVTKEEHKALGRVHSSGWQRYKDARIRVFDAKKQQWYW